MKHQPRFAATAIAAAFFLLSTFACAKSALAQTPSEADCRATVAKEVRSHLNKVLKTISRCHNSRAKGKIALSTDCNDLTEADPSNKLASSRSHLTSAISAACASAPNAVAQYARCPSPGAAADDAGATDGIDDPAELGGCMVALIEGLTPQVMVETMGSPRTRPSKALAKCQKTIGKGVTKLMGTTLKSRSACQSARDLSGMGLNYGCVGADPGGKIASALAKLKSGITKSCNVNDDPGLTLKQELNVLDACADDVSGLQQCSGDVAASRAGSGMAAMAYELPSTCTAGSVLRVLQSGAGQEFTDTFLSTGWTGTAHLVDVLDDARETVFTACDDDCANCTMTLDKHKGQPDAICRCQGNPTISCDTFNAADVDDCGLPIPPGNNTCNCNFGAPLPLSSGGVPVCVLNRHRTDLTNTTMDLGTGHQEGTVNDTATLFLGENTQIEPCPVCSGDTTPNDGVRDGTCTRGLRINQPCDANAIHPDFGAMSHDCPPNLLTNISGSGLVLTQPFKTASQTMPFNLPCTTPPGTMCPCLVCSGNELIGCTSNADCAAVGAGSCNTAGTAASASAQSNACADGVCTCDDTVCSSGTCLAGPDETFCDGIVRQNGRGFLQCNTVADCAAISAGNCTITQKRKCFDDPIEINGDSTMFTANESALFCIPPTNSAAVNNSSGLPGAGVVTLSPELTTLCASDASVAWEPPGGSNCP